MFCAERRMRGIQRLYIQNKIVSVCPKHTVTHKALISVEKLCVEKNVYTDFKNNRLLYHKCMWKLYVDNAMFRL